MVRKTADELKARAFLARYENPYALADFDADRDERASELAREAAFGNPYRFAARDEPADETAILRSTDQATTRQQRNAPPLRGLPKAGFRAQCRRIFSQYVPANASRALPQHYRDFIARNEDRAPDVRAALANELLRYDLSGTPGLRGQFNRERDDVAIAKLADVEKKVLSR
jgi:hypothetical protein